MTNEKAIEMMKYNRSLLGLPDQGDTWKANANTIACDMAIAALEISGTYGIDKTARIISTLRKQGVKNSKWIFDAINALGQQTKIEQKRKEIEEYKNTLFKNATEKAFTENDEEPCEQYCGDCPHRICGKQQEKEPCDNEGLKLKYNVFKADTNEPVYDCFVLRPQKDYAAKEALRAYAEATQNEVLSADIRNWLREMEG